ncbi:MAG: hypothetical protein KKA73_09910 [Chloroflexi bacterium]|nr:hypothetical protein [Chloroflexota bacterium]MBU1747992.1 hypothetical protein [Chloroflexota bacterium]
MRQTGSLILILALLASAAVWPLSPRPTRANAAVSRVVLAEVFESVG